MTLAAGRLCRADSERQLGSVFAATRHYALTALHCVRDGHIEGGVVRRVRCAWLDGSSSEAVVEDWDAGDDVALLRLTRPLPDSLDPIPLAGDLVSGELFVAPGAPAAMPEVELAAVSGMVLWPDAPMRGGSHGVLLVCWQAMAGMSLHGLSGAPVLTDNMQKAVGVIRWNQPRAGAPELAEGAEVYAAPAERIIRRWPSLDSRTDVSDIIRRLTTYQHAKNSKGVYEAVRVLLQTGALCLPHDELQILPVSGDERPGMIAIDVAQVIIKIESRLGDIATEAVAKRELADAVRQRSLYTNQHYVGLLTDGICWRLYSALGPQLDLVDTHNITGTTIQALLDWLEAILTTGKDLPPDRDLIERKLGANSPAYKLSSAQLNGIYQKYREYPTVNVKRRMWAKLLTTASGTDFPDEDSLFVDHTLLVATAKIIGHAVLDIPLDSPEVTASDLMSGALFSQAGINGVVEADFFGWITEVPEGEEFVKRLARQLSRFDWREPKHDVLKDLYESIISEDTRYQLGEYYTPDWLAEAVIADTAKDPLKQRLLDPSCGSGTFLFHAIRRYLDAVEVTNGTEVDAIDGLIKHVMGIDVHPVAVALARVTYLLAIGHNRLQHRAAFSVPVFLGDSMRWGEETDLLRENYYGLSVSTQFDPDSFVAGTATPSEADFHHQLNFPDRLVSDTGRFDFLINRLVDLATTRPPQSAVPDLSRVYDEFRVAKEDQEVLGETFRNMCRLHDREEDHIWGYYVRNLARPTWLSRPQNRVDVLVGNPPWLVYRHMTKRQQDSFRAMTKARGLWTGGTAAASQELAALFVSRCIELYLKPGGRFGYVMPWSILSRPGQRTKGRNAGFRSGNFTTASETISVNFTHSWDLSRLRRSFFPVAASAIFGHRQEPPSRPVPLPEISDVFSGRFDTRRATWLEAQQSITILKMEKWSPGQASPYASKFNAGATVFPRMLFLVEPDKAPFGTVTGRVPVRSRRSPRERKPWKNLRELHGRVEEKFVSQILLGESVLPYFCLDPLNAVIPWDGQRLLAPDDAQFGHYPGLADWWQKAESAWTSNRRGSSERLSLFQRLNYHHDLSRQLPIPAFRVVYNASGAYLAAATVVNSPAVVEHKLYWGATANLEEARYLTAILNSATLTTAVGPMQSRGEHNTRDFDKYMFQLPIPQFDQSDPSHLHLASLAQRAERVAETVAASLPGVRFERQRKYVRDALTLDGVAPAIDAIVKKLLQPDSH
jgi:SAM-dependent methyltransferase